MENAGKRRTILAAAALLGLFGVALLAMGGHGLGENPLRAGGRFVSIHAVVLVALSGHSLLSGWRQALPAALLFAGSLFFGAAVSLHEATGVVQFTYLAPVGGILTMFGWVSLFIAALIKPGMKAES